MTTAYKILCVDDESNIVDLLCAFVEDIGHEPIKASGVASAWDVIRTHHADIAFVVCDYQLGDGSAFDLRKKMLQDYTDIPFCIVSGYISREAALEGIDLQIAAFYEKPIQPAAFQEVIRNKGAARISQIDESRMLAATFFQEAGEILQEVESSIMEFEESPGDKDVVNRIFRQVHTIKGSSGAIGNTDIKEVAHALEDLLTRAKDPSIIPGATFFTRLLRGVDVLKRLLDTARRRLAHDVDILAAVQELRLPDEELAQKVPADAGPSQATAKPRDRVDDQEDKIVVPTETLDEFVRLSGEITVLRNMVRKIISTLERRMQGNAEIKMLSDLLYEMHKINSAMQEKVTEIRKVPMASVFRPLNRIVRDSALQLGKQVSTQVIGGDLRVDTRVSKALSGSLVHMLRNCIDHGIESPEERVKKGKPEKGTVSLSCAEIGENIVVELKDDGKGINLAVVAKKAIEKGLRTEADIAQMSEQEIFQMIFEPGFSTAQIVTDISGRGVGMDMVRTSITQVDGEIHLTSEPDVGTTFTLTIPIPKSVQIINSLIVETGGLRFAVPQEDICRLMSWDKGVHPKQIDLLEGAPMLRFEGQIVPLIGLADTLSLHPGAPALCERLDAIDTVSVVVVRTKSITYGLVVDAILDSEDVVLKPIAKALKKLSAYSAATFLDDGTVGLVLDMEGLGAAWAADHKVRPTSSNSLNVENLNRLDHVLQSENAYLTFTLPGVSGEFGIALSQVHRLETMETSRLRFVRGFRTAVYNDRVMPLLEWPIEGYLGERVSNNGSSINAFVLSFRERFFAMEVDSFHDVVAADGDLQQADDTAPWMLGYLLIEGRNIVVVDPQSIIRNSGLIFVSEKVGKNAVESEPRKTPTTAIGSGTETEACAMEQGAQSEEAIVTANQAWGLF